MSETTTALVTLMKDKVLLNLQTQINKALKESQAISIFSEREVDLAGNYFKNFQGIVKRLEAIRKDAVAPLNTQVKEINEFFKEIKSQIEPEETRLRNEIQEFVRQKRAAEEAERKKEQDELDEQLINEAEMFDDVDVISAVPEIQIKREKLGDISDTMTTMRVKKWKLIDFDKVPRKYLTLDEKMINKIRKEAGCDSESTIEGIEFYTDEVARVK